MIKLLLIVFFSFISLSTQAAETGNALTNVISGAHRSAENKLRDNYRHPEQTLTFFDVQDTMTVVEIWPGDGWYTEILAPYLRDKGKLYAAHFSNDEKSTYRQEKLKSFLDKFKKYPAIYDKVAMTVLAPPSQVDIAPENSVDRVLTFRNVHNWMKSDQAAEVFNAMFKALKPGGILGVVEHRASAIKPQDPKAKSGYVKEDYVIDLARNAGFEFLSKSEINANPKDTKNYLEGVWTLPPTLKLKDKDREKYLAIGESDRMTLKFVKPQPNALANFIPRLLAAEEVQAQMPEIPSVIHKSR
jgi:predicted methyltransferase